MKPALVLQLFQDRVDADRGVALPARPRVGAWFETGIDPVEARAVSDEPAAFVRVMVLPLDLLGRSSIRYMRDSDRERPKPQRYQVFVDQPLEL